MDTCIFKTCVLLFKAFMDTFMKHFLQNKMAFVLDVPTSEIL